jgi:hypothetical protein
MDNPAWCPHNDCICLSWRQCFCVGRLPVPVPHDGIDNTHRWCLNGASDEGGVLDLLVNSGDLWNFVVLFDIVRRDEGRTPILGSATKPAPNNAMDAILQDLESFCTGRIDLGVNVQVYKDVLFLVRQHICSAKQHHS